MQTPYQLRSARRGILATGAAALLAVPREPESPTNSAQPAAANSAHSAQSSKELLTNTDNTRAEVQSLAGVGNDAKADATPAAAVPLADTNTAGSTNPEGFAPPISAVNTTAERTTLAHDAPREGARGPDAGRDGAMLQPSGGERTKPEPAEFHTV